MSARLATGRAGLVAVAVLLAGCGTTSTEDPPVAQATPLPDASVPVATPSPTDDPTDEPEPSEAPEPEPAQDPEAAPDPLTATTCEVGAVPDDLDVDRSHYSQGCVVLGHPLLAADDVDPAALVAAAEIVVGMLRERPDLAVVMADARARTTIVARDAGITTVPEYWDLRADESMDWDARSRGFGGQPATADWPESPGSAGEEDVLCLPEDRYYFESIMVHEFGHTMWDAGVVVQDPSMQDRLDALYADALAAGTWADTYAEETVFEYWAEGLQSWFDSNDTAEPSNGIHGHIDTNAELLAEDPGLHALVTEVVGDTDWRWSC